MQNKRIILLLLTIIAVMISINLAFAAHYEYDDLGRLVRVDYSNEQTTKSASYSYDPGGNIVGVTGFQSVTEITTEGTTETVTEYYFFHDTAKDNYSESNPNLYFDSALKEGTSRAPKGLIEYRRQNNTIFVFPANGDMYNYIDIYDLCGRSISDDYEKASEPTA